MVTIATVRRIGYEMGVHTSDYCLRPREAATNVPADGKKISDATAATQQMNATIKRIALSVNAAPAIPYLRRFDHGRGREGDEPSRHGHPLMRKRCLQ